MKTTALILFLIPAFIFAQQGSNATLKPATDACPSWNKKSNSSSKAEYFYFLRTGKVKDNQTTAYNYPNSSQRAYPSQKIVRYAPEEDPFLVPKRSRNNTPTTPKRASASRFGGSANIANADPGNSEQKPAEIKPLPKQEPVPASVQKEEPKITEVAPLGESNTDSKPALKKDRQKKERRSKRLANRASGQTIKNCKSGDASKCLSF